VDVTRLERSKKEGREEEGEGRTVRPSVGSSCELDHRDPVPLLHSFEGDAHILARDEEEGKGG